MLQDNTSSKVESVNVKQFYGKSNIHCRPIPEKSCNTGLFQRSHQPIKQLPFRLNNLCGPSQVWRVFPKQKEALEFVRTKRSGLVTFAFQQSDGVRLFLVAHPQIFWHYDIQKNPTQRCSFEVIPESSASKLYFDLEYDTKCNPSKRGALITNSFIVLVLYFIKEVFNIRATRENVLHLDSSTCDKFSRHLVFQLGSHVFCNYQSVGEFVRFVCQKLLFYLESCSESDDSNINPLGPDDCKCCQLPSLKKTSCIRGANISLSELKELVVLNRKGNKCLICDLSVYSKNRHFRLYQNTKWMKSSPLVICEDNLYQPFLSPTELLSDEVASEAFFLDSLVSYIRLSQTCSKEPLLIHFVNPLHISCSTVGENDNILIKTVPQTYPVLTSENYITKSPYPEVDDFISSVVLPGRIYRLAYFSSSNTIVYDIVGNRFCHNIKRQHRSNNIKYIVHLESCTYYQKCHDLDCSTFRSNPQQLPEDLKFQLSDDCSISDSDLNELASVVEDLCYNLQEN